MDDKELAHQAFTSVANAYDEVDWDDQIRHTKQWDPAGPRWNDRYTSRLQKAVDAEDGFLEAFPEMSEKWQGYKQKTWPQFGMGQQAMNLKAANRLDEAQDSLDRWQLAANVGAVIPGIAAGAIHGATLGFVDPKKMELFDYLEELRQQDNAWGFAHSATQDAASLTASMMIPGGLASKGLQKGFQSARRVIPWLERTARAAEKLKSSTMVGRAVSEGVRMAPVGAAVHAGMVPAERMHADNAIEKTRAEIRQALNDNLPMRAAQLEQRLEVEEKMRSEMHGLIGAAVEGAATWGTLSSLSHPVHEVLGKSLLKLETPWPALTGYLRRTVEGAGGVTTVAGYSAATAPEGERWQAFKDSLAVVGLSVGMMPAMAVGRERRQRSAGFDQRVRDARKELGKAKKIPEEANRKHAVKQAEENLATRIDERLNYYTLSNPDRTDPETHKRVEQVERFRQHLVNLQTEAAPLVAENARTRSRLRVEKSELEGEIRKQLTDQAGRQAETMADPVESKAFLEAELERIGEMHEFDILNLDTTGRLKEIMADQVKAQDMEQGLRNVQQAHGFIQLDYLTPDVEVQGSTGNLVVVNIRPTAGKDGKVKNFAYEVVDEAGRRWMIPVSERVTLSSKAAPTKEEHAAATPEEKAELERVTQMVTDVPSILDLRDAVITQNLEMMGPLGPSAEQARNVMGPLPQPVEGLRAGHSKPTAASVNEGQAFGPQAPGRPDGPVPFGPVNRGPAIKRVLDLHYRKGEGNEKGLAGLKTKEINELGAQLDPDWQAGGPGSGNKAAKIKRLFETATRVQKGPEAPPVDEKAPAADGKAPAAKAEPTPAVRDEPFFQAGEPVEVLVSREQGLWSGAESKAKIVEDIGGPVVTVEWEGQRTRQDRSRVRPAAKAEEAPAAEVTPPSRTVEPEPSPEPLKVRPKPRLSTGELRARDEAAMEVLNADYAGELPNMSVKEINNLGHQLSDSWVSSGKGSGTKADKIKRLRQASDDHRRSLLEPAPTAEPAAELAPEPAPSPRAPIEMVMGKTAKAQSGKGLVQKVNWAVAEMDDLVPSHDILNKFEKTGDYPHQAGIQKRDHKADESLQKNAWAYAEDLGREGINAGHYISDALSVTEGAPTVTREGFALAGNTRIMSLIAARARSEETRGALQGPSNYRNLLLEKAEQFGLDRKAIEDMDSPVLVRVTERGVEHEDVREFARASNTSQTNEMSTLDRAAHLAPDIPEHILKQLDLEPEATLSDILSGHGGKDFRRSINENLDRTQRALYFENSNPEHLTAAGRELVRNIMLVKAVPVDVVKAMSDSQRISFTNAIPQLIDMKKAQLPQTWNPLPALTEAVLRFNGELQGGRIKVETHYDQGQLIGDNTLHPAVRGFLDYLMETKGKKLKLKHDMQAFLRVARESSGIFLESSGSPIDAAREIFGKKFFKGAEDFKLETGLGDIFLAHSGGINPEIVQKAARAVFSRLPRRLRRAVTRRFEGREDRAAMQEAYRLDKGLRPVLSDAFHHGMQKEIIKRMRKAKESDGRTADVMEMVFAGKTMPEIVKEMYPNEPTLDGREMLNRSVIEALGHAIDLKGKGAVTKTLADLRKFNRDVLDPELSLTLSFDELRSAAVSARIRGEKVPNLNRFSRAMDGPHGTMSFETASSISRGMDTMRKSIVEYEQSMVRIDGLLKRMGGTIVGEGLDGKRNVTDIATWLFDAAEGLVRREPGKKPVMEEADAFTRRMQKVLNAQEAGRGNDFVEAVQLFRNAHHAVRSQARGFGVELSANLPDMLYAAHMWGQEGHGARKTRAMPYRDMPIWFRNEVSRKVHSRFSLARKGNLGYNPDPIGTMRHYGRSMIRKIHIEGMFAEGTDAHVAIYGEWGNFGRAMGKRTLGKAFKVTKTTEADGTDHFTAKLRNNREGINILEEFARIATAMDNPELDVHLRVPAAAVARVLDVNGEPILIPGGAAQGQRYVERVNKKGERLEPKRVPVGWENFLRASKSPSLGDSTFSLRSARDGAPDIEIPFVNPKTGSFNLHHFQVKRGGLQELARMGMESRWNQARDLVKFLKGERDGGKTDRYIEKYTRALRTLAYENALFSGNPKPAVDNFAGGHLMLVHDVGLARASEATAHYVKVARGRDPKMASLIERANIGEQQHVEIEGAPTAPGGVARAYTNLSRAPFGFAEKSIRGISFIAGFKRWMKQAEKLQGDFIGRNNLSMEDRITIIGRSVWLEPATRDAEPVKLEGADLFLHSLDPTKRRQKRSLKVSELAAEAEEAGILWGRYTVAKTQFNYDAAMTPTAMKSGLGKVLLQLNQYPIRAAAEFMRTMPGTISPNPEKFTRWIVNTGLISLAAYAVDEDLTPALGLKPADTFLFDENDWVQESEHPVAQVAREVHSPVPMPYGSGVDFPLLQMGKGIGHLLVTALQMDSSNPLPAHPGAADLVAQLYEGWQRMPRKQKTILSPRPAVDLVDLLNSEWDEETSEIVIRYGPGQPEEYRITIGGYAREYLLPGAPDARYDHLERINRMRRQDDRRREASGARNRDLLANELERQEPGERGLLHSAGADFRERQSERLSKDFALDPPNEREIARRASRIDLPREVEMIAGGAVVDRTRRFLAWAEAEKPTPERANQAWGRIMGDTMSKRSANFRKLSKADSSYASALLDQAYAVERMLEASEGAGEIDWGALDEPK